MPRPVAVVAEDEPFTRMDASEIFEEVGYEVLQASDAHEAWSVLEGRNDVILLLTDVEMPGTMNGLDLAKKVHDYWPQIEVIVCSGGALPEQAELPTPVMFLGKPVDRMTLQEKARETVAVKFGGNRASLQ